MNKKRNILLVEPRYKNKYPPIGLMKLATYHRNLGDNVVFFKGDLKDFVIENIYNEVLEKLKQIENDMDWEKQRTNIIRYIKTKNRYILEDILNGLTKNKPLLTECLNSYSDFYKKREYLKNPRWDRIYISTLFTFYWKITIETINFAKNLVKDIEELKVGGVMATVLSDEIKRETGIKPWCGLLDKPSILDDNDIIVDELPLDYSILDEIDYKYPENNAYYSYMTRGCPNDCEFCAVSKIEPKYKEYISIKKNFEHVRKKFGEKQNLLLLDNNVLASPRFPEIIEEIKNLGFVKGATYVEPNQFEIAISNLKKGKNDDAYVKKTFYLIHDLLNKLERYKNVRQEVVREVYNILGKYDLLKIETATKSNLLKVYPILSDIYEKYRYKGKKSRHVDFNQGVDARYITEKKMKLLSEIPIKPLRIAFDNIKLKDKYVKSVKWAAKYAIRDISNYLLYNYKDKPDDLYQRLRISVDLCEELDVNIYSFPMKYIPIHGDDSKDRSFLEKRWNKKFIGAIQAILNATKGKVGRGKSFFERAFGKNLDEFHELLYMPETYIIYRKIFEELGYTQEWRKAYKQLTEKERKKANKIIETNDFSNYYLKTKNKKIMEVLKHYTIKRDDVKKEDEGFKDLKNKFDGLIKT
ncbi:hypothetical protein BEH94_11675 [Candidatus Altiarchaeales archaeon WOR_SM1_SCG]|nr:hypothetical protein BEH94_11675 [Candidatus Altiarchaeales archaeon WOR_SM1_SCG]